jgi:hypothetical protein
MIHPWEEFLNARAAVLIWMRDEKKNSNEEIAQMMSMDAEQVKLIFLNLGKYEEEGKSE